ncbi:MAG: AraC family ligand binding domain-containing protein [Spirochaetia bacterium]|nr:AraC family ligand binding domain-containing protein [Spirochaetia bacterium]
MAKKTKITPSDPKAERQAFVLPSILEGKSGGLVGSRSYNLLLNVRPGNWTYSSHTHSFIEIGFVLYGSGTHLLGNQTYPLRANSLYIIPPGVSHTVEINRELAWYNLTLTMDVLPDFLEAIWSTVGAAHLFYPLESDGARQLDLTEEDAIPLRHMMVAWTHIKASQGGLIDLQVRSLLVAILTHIVRLQSLQSQKPQLMDHQVITLIKSVEKVLDDQGDINLEKVFKLSRLESHLAMARFKNCLSITLPQYFQKRKIWKSLLLLKRGIRATELADRFGFSDAAHFSRTFSEVVGVSPREWLKQN